MRGTLRIGFFPDFKGQDTLLLSGDGEALTSLGEAFRSLAAVGAGRLRLDGLPFVEAHGRVVILAEQSPRSSGLRYVTNFPYAEAPGPPLGFLWRLSKEDWEDVAERVAALQRAGSGHQYLDYLGVLGDSQVMESLNEYGAAWWQRHG
jgi:hypothetical protein